MVEVNEKIAIEHGLKSEEYKKICDLLKRTPNITELGVFSAMWNEHCSYKSSRRHLKKLHTKGDQVIQGPGENAAFLRRRHMVCLQHIWSITASYPKY